MRKIASCLVCLFMMGALRAQSASGVADGFNYLEKEAKAIPFQPLDYADIKNPDTGEPLQENDIVLVESDGYFEPILAQDILEKFNVRESLLNEIGMSLRVPLPEISVGSLPNPHIFLREFRVDPGLNLNSLVDGFQVGADTCADIGPQSLGVNSKTGKPYEKTDVINVPGYSGLTAGKLIPKLNQSQKYFCALGYSILENVAGPDFLAGILAKRDELAKKFGLDANHPIVGLANWVESLNYEEIESRFKEAQEVLKNPTPANLYQLAKTNSDLLPPELKLPDLPTVKQPALERRVDLKLKKAKRWKGFDVGNKDFVQAFANAWYELRSGRIQEPGTPPVDEQALQGEAIAGINMLRQELRVLYTSIDAQLNETTAFAKLTYCLLSFCKEHKKGLENAAIRDGNPKLFEKNWREEVAYQAAVGPIPVVFRAGGSLYARAGWNVALTLLSAHGGIDAEATATAVGAGAVGIKDFIEGGVEGQVDVIKGVIAVNGDAMLKFLGAGYPVIEAAITGDYEMTYLAGRLYAYALVDVGGGVVEFLNEIVDSIKDLGGTAESALKALSGVSDVAKKAVKKLQDAAASAAKALKKLGKKLGFAGSSPISITGTKIRYTKELLAIEGRSTGKKRFLNYKVFIGRDGEEMEGDIEAVAEAQSILDQNIDLSMRETLLDAQEKAQAEVKLKVLSELKAFVDSENSQTVGKLAGSIQESLAKQDRRLLDVMARTNDL